jgi:hypothetical protein
MTRTCLLAAVTATVALAAAAQPVLALPPDETLDFDVAVLSGPAAVSPSVDLVGGNGNFTFNSASGLGGCALLSASGTGSEAGEAAMDVEATRTCSVSALGSYVNVVCGTGVAWGSGTITEGSGSDTYAVTFQVMFVAGTGYLTGVVTESESDGDGAAGAQPLYGVVNLVPLETPPPPVGQCTNKFTAAVTLATTA